MIASVFFNLLLFSILFNIHIYEKYNQMTSGVVGYFLAELLYSLITAISCLLDLQLLLFHLWLIYHKMTTYEYILKKRQRLASNMERNNLNQENQNKQEVNR